MNERQDFVPIVLKNLVRWSKMRGMEEEEECG